MINNSPFFSIIIPTYNRAHVIARAVESVIKQNFTDWELIIIDDGSTDNTSEIFAQFDDSKIKYIYQKNTERSEARNNGIKLATGKYICFLDSDDEYCEHHLSALYEFIEKKNFPKAMFFTNPIVIQNNVESQEQVAHFNPAKTLDYILINSIIPNRVAIHKAIFDIYKFDRKIYIGEDTILWAQITNSFPLFHVNDYTVKYHVHDDNSVNLKNNVYKNRLAGLMQLFNEKEIKKRLSKQLKNQIISVCYFGMARHFELKRKFFKMTIHALLSIFYDIKSPLNKAKIYMIYSFFKHKSI